MIRFAVLTVALVASACAAATAAPVPVAVPELDGVMALSVAAQADVAAADAMASLDSSGLSTAFRVRALQVLRDQVGRMRERSIRLEERDAVRTLQTWDAGRREVVVQIESQVRLTSSDQPDPPWSNSMRRWWARLAYIAGGWWVIDQRNLAPDQGRAP